MRHGYYMWYGNGGSIILLILLIIAVIVFIAFLNEHLRKKNDPEYNRFLEILKEKYVKNDISSDEYRERSILLEDEYWYDSANPELLALKEQYARCEITSRKYVERKEELKSASTRHTAMDILKERYARGEISAEQYEKIKRDIR